jgi:hypothetical protein
MGGWAIRASPPLHDAERSTQTLKDVMGQTIQTDGSNNPKTRNWWKAR